MSNYKKEKVKPIETVIATSSTSQNTMGDGCYLNIAQRMYMDSYELFGKFHDKDKLYHTAGLTIKVTTTHHRENLLLKRRFSTIGDEVTTTGTLLMIHDMSQKYNVEYKSLLQIIALPRGKVVNIVKEFTTKKNLLIIDLRHIDSPINERNLLEKRSQRLL